MPRWKWEYESILRTLEEFSGDPGPADPRARKRLRIVAAATELFIRQGYRKTSMEEVARLAGVAKGTVYLYFRNKAELLVHAIVEEKKLYVVRLEPIMRPEVPAREKLRRWLALAFVLPADMPLISRLISGDREILAAMQDLPAEMQQQLGHMQVDILSDLVDAAASPHGWSRPEVEDRARVIVGLIYTTGAFADERIRQGLSLERFGSILADMLMDGLGGGDAEDRRKIRGGKR